MQRTINIRAKLQRNEIKRKGKERKKEKGRKKRVRLCLYIKETMDVQPHPSWQPANARREAAVPDPISQKEVAEQDREKAQ